MCGIAGIFNYNSSEKIDEQSLTGMSHILAHRGPDGEGLYVNGKIGLAHRRLAIIDLTENGSQPFISEDGRYVIIYNGEIFNFLELKSDLSKFNFRYRSDSDTEVLLYLYIQYGPSILEKLNGMFAFAIWDNHEQSLFIARDRLGIKPVYYSDLSGTFMFASEQKALIKAGVPKTVAEDEFQELLLYRFISGEKTLYKNIFKLLPGYYLFIKDERISKTRWWNLGEKIRINRERLPNDVFDWFEDAFSKATNYRMISDRPVGILLSGGLDSSSITAQLAKLNFSNISTFTVGFNEPNYDEGKLAKKVAEKYNCDYHEIKLDADKVHQSLEDAAWFHDEPLIHQNDPHLLAVSQYAKKYVAVLLSGEGADELMGGYVRYKALNYLSLKDFAMPLLGIAESFSSNARIRKLHRFYKLDASESVMLNGCSFYPNDFKNPGISFNEINYHNNYRLNLFNEAKEVYPKDAGRQAMYLDLHTYLSSLLERNDKMTMAASIECRVPFLDHFLIEMIGAIKSSDLLKGRKGKYLLYNTIGKKLPDEVRKYKKNGFSVPWESYLKNNEKFKNELHEMPNNPFFKSGLFAQINISQLIKRFKNDDQLATVLLRQLLMIHMWYKNFYAKI